MDTRTLQQQLHDVGFPIAVDGVPGAETTRAVTYFQQGYGRGGTRLQVDGIAGTLTQQALQRCHDEGGLISAHFKFPEFACTHCHWPRVHWALTTDLEVYRARLSPNGLSVVSGYRCPIHNAQIPGAAPNSQHLYGLAADVTPIARTATVIGLRLFSGIEYRRTGLVYHVDVRHAVSATNWTRSTPDRPSVFRFGLLAGLTRRKVTC